MDWKTCPYISFNFVKPKTRTHFFAIQILDTLSPLLSFIGALESLATLSEAQLKLLFFEKETAINIKVSSTLRQLNQKHSHWEGIIDYDNDEYFNVTAEEMVLSTQFLQTQKNKLIVLQEHFKRYCNTLPVFGFNSAEYDINLIKSCLLPILVNERKLNQQLSRKLISLFASSLLMCSYLIFWTFLVGLLVLTRSSKIIKRRKPKLFSPMSCSTVVRQYKLKNKKVPSYDFFSKLRNVNPLEKDYNDSESLTTSGLSSEQAVCKLRPNKIPLTGNENYA